MRQISDNNLVGWPRVADPAPDVGMASDFLSLGRFDMALAEPVARSLRLNGKSTCIRLERIYWEILDCAAATCGVSAGILLSGLDREVQLRFGNVRNFSSLARVVAVTQLAKLNPCVSSRVEHRR